LLFNDILEEKNKEKYNKIVNITKAILLLSQVKTDIINFKKTKNKQEKEIEIQNNLEKYNIDF
jgi:hypothetical protein